MSEMIFELEQTNDKEKELELKIARNTRLFWRVVIKDLEKILRKEK